MSANNNGTLLLKEITLRNLLSFGPKTEAIVLNHLNVLIGINGSGKSNLLEAIVLLRSAATDIRAVIRKGSGVTEWIWKGSPDANASAELLIHNPFGHQALRHFLSFHSVNQSFVLQDERIEKAQPDPGESRPYFYYHYEHGRPVLNVKGENRKLMRENVELDSSILAQRRDPEMYPEVTYLGSTYDKIRIYREWAFGRNTVFREPQKADARNDRLEEDFSNLGLFLNRLRRLPQAKNAILAALRDLYDGISDFDVSIEGGTVQVFFTEGNFTIPATRLSDGTLRYLCLLAILCDPTPPPVICIEEPELGLHPDIIPKIADLLKKAAEKTQLLITTHSDILIDALSDQPESVLVCEKQDGQTMIRRLVKNDLTAWLEKYRLGQLWTKGQIGGTRW